MDKLDKSISFRQQCEIARNENNLQCSEGTFRNYAEKHGIDKAIYHYLYEYKPMIKRDKSIRQIWIESGLPCSYDYFKNYVREHSEMTIKQVINKLKEPRKISLKQIYDSAGLSDICTYGSFKNYVRNHPDLAVEQIIQFYKTEYKPVNIVKRNKSLKEVHAESGLMCSYSTFKAYVVSSKDKSLEEVIEYLKNNYIPRKEIVDNSLSKIWRDNKLNCNVNYFIKYVREHPEEDINNIIEKFKQSKEISLNSICKRENADVYSIRGYMKRYNITIDEAIEMYRKKEKEDKERREFKEFCEKNGLNYNTAWVYKNNHLGITNDEIVEHYKHESIASKCRRLGLSYNAVTGYKQAHPEMDYDDIIEMYLQPKEICFTAKCRQAGIHAISAASYKAYHPELTDEQIIIYYRPDCYINILGELVIPDKEDKEK